MRLSWIDVIRLGLVQTALGSIVVLCTSTMNRVMVVEFALPAILPGLLVGLHYAVQLSRPRWGHGSDVGGRRTPFIIGGMAVLAAGGILAAAAIALVPSSFALSITAMVIAYLLIGIGVGASGTSLLAMLATHVAPSRRAAAASTVWLMMIAGFVITAGTVGHFLDPFSVGRLVQITAIVAAIALFVTVAALFGVEKKLKADQPPDAAEPELKGRKLSFREVLSEVWEDPKAKAFTIFVFVSMLAYSAQDLILEPFAGVVFGLSPGASTKLAGVQHGGVLLGMLCVAFAASGKQQARFGTTRTWTVGGCLASGVALLALAVAGTQGQLSLLKPLVFFLGLANGAFAVAAIGWMMRLAGAPDRNGHETGREGIRMGLWGAAQAMAFGLGGFAGTAGVDVVRYLSDVPALPYIIVFVCEAALFWVAAVLAARMEKQPGSTTRVALPPLSEARNV